VQLRAIGVHVATAITRRRQCGVSMIEVLVTILIFAFGMLALSGLQLRALAFSQSSLYRSQATALSDDIIDRMRADRGNAKNGKWDTSLADDPASSFPSTAIYDVDRKDWKLMVGQLLPSGHASIDVTAGVVTIVVQWDDSRGREPPQTLRTVSRL
jgi:type IV pilus assembly protein PilV